MEQTISAAEWQVMRVLWAQPGTTSQEIIQALKEGFDWQATTVKTLLGRLRKKTICVWPRKQASITIIR